MNITELPNAELAIMKVIWANEEPVSSKLIVEKLKEIKNWEYVTTYTLLRRLVKKEFLNANVLRHYTLYTTNVSREEYNTYATELFIEKIFDGNIENFKKTLVEVGASK